MFKLKKHILVIYAILSGMIILLIGFSAKVFIPVEINRTGQVIVKIERGQSLISIAKELETLLGRRVDLGTKDSLKPFARFSVLREALVVYAT